MISLRQIASADIPLILTFFDEGRRFQRHSGYLQWPDHYPAQTTIIEDMQAERGYMILVDGTPAGYVMINTAGDAEYDRLGHIWKTQGTYAAVHRIVFSDAFRGLGLGKKLIETIEERCMQLRVESVRFDTGAENTAMQRVLEKTGYTNLGSYDFVWGPRLAYEKPLPHRSI